MNKYLVINGGSSSLKFSLYKEENGQEIELVNGLIERIGMEGSCFKLKFNGKTITQKTEEIIQNHTESIKIMLELLYKNNFIDDINEISGIGHRVLHGGEYFSDSVVINEEVLNNIKSLESFGPLHLPGEISVIESMKELLPNIPQIAVFDTAFHQTIPMENYLYAIPYDYYTKYGIRKYGFHGTSHKYITEIMKKKLNKENINIINIHWGNGASVCAIKDSKSYNTTMGFTPLDGLIMGTRSGTIDSSIQEYICNKENITINECTNILNKRSGLLGISEVSSDMRDIIKAKEEGNAKAKLALDMCLNSIVNHIGTYYFELEGNVDAIVFTAGIGENCYNLREIIIDKLSKSIDTKLNKEENDNIAAFRNKKEGLIATGKVPCYVIPTNEEYMILKDTIRLSKEKGVKKVLKY